MMRKFWLIPRQCTEELEEAAYTLFNNGRRVAQSSPEDKVVLMEALDLSHLMKFFYSPHTSSFLDKADYAEYQNVKAINEETLHNAQGSLAEVIRRGEKPYHRLSNK